MPTLTIPAYRLTRHSSGTFCTGFRRRNGACTVQRANTADTGLFRVVTSTWIQVQSVAVGSLSGRIGILLDTTDQWRVDEPYQCIAHALSLQRQGLPPQRALHVTRDKPLGDAVDMEDPENRQGPGASLCAAACHQQGRGGRQCHGKVAGNPWQRPSAYPCSDRQWKGLHIGRVQNVHGQHQPCLHGQR